MADPVYGLTPAAAKQTGQVVRQVLRTLPPTGRRTRRVVNGGTKARHFGILTSDMPAGSLAAPSVATMEVWTPSPTSVASPPAWIRTTNTDLQNLTIYNLDCSKEGLEGGFVKVEYKHEIWTPYWVGEPCPCGTCTYDGGWTWNAFDILCSGSTTTQNLTGSPELRPCESGNPDSPSWPDCTADGWVECQWYYQGNIASTGFGMDLVEVTGGYWRLKVFSGILCNGHGCASDAIYLGSMEGCTGPLVLSLERWSNIGDDPVTEYLTPPTSCAYVDDGTVVTWPDTITLNRVP